MKSTAKKLATQYAIFGGLNLVCLVVVPSVLLSYVDPKDSTNIRALFFETDLSFRFFLWMCQSAISVILAGYIVYRIITAHESYDNGVVYLAGALAAINVPLVWIWIAFLAAGFGKTDRPQIYIFDVIFFVVYLTLFASTYRGTRAR